MADDIKSPETVHQEKMGDIEVVQTVHQDGTVDYVDTHAVGGDLAQMPEGYYRSVQFVGTVIVSSTLVEVDLWGRNCTGL